MLEPAQKEVTARLQAASQAFTRPSGNILKSGALSEKIKNQSISDIAAAASAVP